jgi:nuclear pore complex protein Nup54
MPAHRNEDGLMSLIVRKKAAEISAPEQQQRLSDEITAVIGGAQPQQRFRVSVLGVRAARPDAAEISFVVHDSTAGGRPVASSEMHAFLMQPAQVQGLQQRLAAESVSPKVSFTEEQIKEYLDNPPNGIDIRLW